MRVSDSNDEVYKHTDKTHQGNKPKRLAKASQQNIYIYKEGKTESFFQREMNERNFFSRVFYTHTHGRFVFFFSFNNLKGSSSSRSFSDCKSPG